MIDRDQIYLTYYPKVLSYIKSRITNGFTAEDLAQNVFVKVYSKLETFDESKSAISTWIYNITRNTVIDYFRSSASKVHTEIPETLTDDSEDISQGIIMEEQQELLADALERLSQQERDLIILYYHEGHTLTNIAQMMNLPYGQIKRLHIKALNQLRLMMGD